jgi:hypothetical protein
MIAIGILVILCKCEYGAGNHSATKVDERGRYLHLDNEVRWRKERERHDWGKHEYDNDQNGQDPDND